MNAEHLLAQFERISEAPDAIARLRRFILDLAVRGKLVEQDPEDEPAEELLGRISYEKARLARAGEIKKPKQLPEIDEAPFVVPSNWTWCRIREATSDRAQKVPSERFTYIDVGAINKEAGLISEPTILEPTKAPSRARKIVKKGDVIYSCVRPYLLNVAIVDLDFDPEPIASTAFAVLCGHELVLPRYLWIVLRTPFMVNCVEESQRGQAYPAINDADFSLLPFPLPPLGEQHRIVAKVNELMALCDQLEAARQQREQGRERLIAATLQRLNQPAEDPANFRQDASFALQVLPSLTTTPAQIKQLRQTILNMAVRGKLVEQDPEDEPAEELVRLIADDKKLRMAERRIRAPRNAHSVNSEDVPLDLPPSWKTFPLGDISLVSDPNPSHRYPSYDGGTVPILSTQEFSGLDGWNPSTAKLVQREFHDYQVDSCNFEPGDIVFARKGRIGLPRFLPSLERYAFSHTVFIVKPLCGVYPQYLLWALRRQAVVDWLTKEMNQNTGVPTLGKDKTERLPIPLPPLSEQHRIVAKVDTLLALCDQLEQQLNQADQQRRRLLEALLAEALGGRLPTEEESHATVA
jgi:type I restriction enzyme S subunit